MIPKFDVWEIDSGPYDYAHVCQGHVGLEDFIAEMDIGLVEGDPPEATDLVHQWASYSKDEETISLHTIARGRGRLPVTVWWV